jgi:hypothetical protein
MKTIVIQEQFDLNHPALQEFDYVWFSGEYDFDKSVARDMFQKMKIHSLKLAYPAWEIGGFYDRPFNVQKIWSEYRLTNFLDLNCPIISKDINIFETNNPSFDWPLQGRTAILDSTPIYCNRPPLKSRSAPGDPKEIIENNVPLEWESRCTALKVIDTLNLKVGVEVGVMFGTFSCMLLAGTKTKKLYCVDHWENERFLNRAQLDLSKFSNRVEMIKEDSSAAAGKFEDGSIDYIFIDANHTYDGVKKDIECWWPKLRIGGLFFGHDYIGGDRFKHFGVIRAVDEFSSREKQSVRVLGTSSIKSEDKHYWSNWWDHQDSRMKIDPFQCWWCIKSRPQFL